MSSPSTSTTSVASFGSEANDSISKVEYRFPPNGLRANYFPGLEDLCLYQAGGHHPVHLEDGLGDKKQYRVIEKLGTGGFGNVWLCRIVNRIPTEYVAVKILMAEASVDQSKGKEAKNLSRLLELAKADPDITKYCLLPLDQFVIEGPNGTHQCFVYPAAGPRVGKISIRAPNPTRTLRRMVRQAVEAMAALHRQGICHGDFRPGNILLRLDGLNGLPEEEACEYFNWPEVCDITVKEGYPKPRDSAPEYLVLPAEPDDDHLANAANLCVIDYGEAFDASSPPENGVGIPLPYCAPEIILEGSCGVASDIWALAATIFEIRTGRKLVELLDDYDSNYLDDLVQMLGPMPEPWWSTTWEDRGDYFLDELDADGRALPADGSLPLSNMSIVDRMRGNVLHSFLGEGKGRIRFMVPEKEKPIFEDLLKMMLRWKPEDRPSAEEVLKHPWFALEDEDEEVVPMELEVEPEDEETEDETESDGEGDGEMSDAEMEGANERGNEPNSNHEISSTVDNKNDHMENEKDNQADNEADVPKANLKDDQKDDEDVNEPVAYQRVEQMECHKDDQDETLKVNSPVEKVQKNSLVSEKSGLLKVAVDTRFRGVAAWVKKALKWSRK
ncbi:kinase-like domain-containing protein [Aspergillus pseudodeflectus]|uniref:EKC/KEOPS complex subunit BUD32 n=1 Tax=Aspergillus pseudodeflectus TaxID=176178 RepID=A0ABR4JWU6_9EURO